MRAFPHSERRVLTNFADGAKVATIDTILGPMNLVHGYFRYPLNARNPLTLWRVMQQIRLWGPEVLVYLAAPRGRLKALRDALFFKLCGISKLIGVPWHSHLQTPRKKNSQDLWESEACRMTRCLVKLGDVTPDDPQNYDLELTIAERQKAEKELAGWEGVQQYIAASIGTKADSKDWGRENWKALFLEWERKHPGLGLVLVGSADEAYLSGNVVKKWRGPLLNLCGRLTPRETAAVLEKAALFVGHDSGPMHLSAAVGTPCVAIFSARNRPGEWYPSGTQHYVIYHRVPCYGCGLTVCNYFDKMCIRSITVDEVFTAMNELYESRQL